MSLRTYCYGLMHDLRHGFLDNGIKFFLWLISLVYGQGALLRRWAYAKGILPAYQSPKPVISVGNITLGGVGKTPLVIAIAQALMARGLKVAVLIRGYMPSKEAFSDEALMLKERLPGVPIITGKNRATGIKSCLKHHAVDVFVCDDAFGHLQLRRDLNIVAIDTVNPFGNGQVIPRGILREPLSALSAADIIVLTKTDLPNAKVETRKSQIETLIPGVLVVQAVHKPKGCVEISDQVLIDLEHFKGVTVVGFSGIGDTNAFKHTLEEAGFQVAQVIGFMDHHVYGQEDIEIISKCARDNHALMVVTTHKDAVKLAAFKDAWWTGLRVYYLTIDVEITYGKNAFMERIIAVTHH